MITPRNIAKNSARVADDMKAADIVVLDVRKLCDIADYLVICTGQSCRQLRGMARRLCTETPKSSVAAPRARVEGEEGSPWVLLDFGDVVVHLFDPEAREFYDLELLWGDAPKVAWKKKHSPRTCPP